MAQNEQWKATIVFYVIDAFGHIQPILSIVSELRRRGYRAIIVNNKPMSATRDLVKRGFELEYCCEYGEVGTKDQKASEQSNNEGPATEDKKQSEEQVLEAVSSLSAQFRLGPVDAFKTTYGTGGVLEKYLQDFINSRTQIENKLESLKPDLIVVDHVLGIACATKIARRWIRFYSGFPSAIVCNFNENYVAGMGLRPEEMTTELVQLQMDVKRPLREKIVSHFAEQGLPDWESKTDMAPTSPYLNFCLGPNELSLDGLVKNPLPEYWYRLEHTIEPISEEQLKTAFHQIVPKSLLDQPGKIVYFSLGTLVSSDFMLINSLLEKLSKSPNKFIVSMGPMHERVKLFPNMWGTKFLDQRTILANVDLFITHGGHNSIIEAFYYGVPSGLIVLPIFADQFDSAQRVEDSGFGRRLNPYECSEEQLLTAVHTLLDNSKLRQRMKGISDRLKSIQYHKIAADKIEAVLKN